MNFAGSCLLGLRQTVAGSLSAECNGKKLTTKGTYTLRREANCEPEATIDIIGEMRLTNTGVKLAV